MITNYHEMQAYILNRNSETPLDYNPDETFVLYRGINCLEQAIAIFEQGTAGGWSVQADAKYPGHRDNPPKDGKTELERIIAQKGTGGESAPMGFYRNPWAVKRSKSFIEYTAEKSVAWRFGSSSSVIRGGVIGIEIKAQYVNDTSPGTRDEVEYGLFCSSAAPIIKCQYACPEANPEMIEKFNGMREGLPPYEELMDRLNHAIGEGPLAGKVVYQESSY